MNIDFPKVGIIPQTVRIEYEDGTTINIPYMSAKSLSAFIQEQTKAIKDVSFHTYEG